jgi:hypothetical protein
MIVSIGAVNDQRRLGWCARLRAKVVSFEDESRMSRGARSGLVNVQLEGMHRRFESKVLTKKLFVQIPGRWLHEWTPAYELTLAAQARKSGVPLPPVDSRVSRVRVRKRRRGASTEPLESESASGEESDQQSSAEDAAAEAVGAAAARRRFRGPSLTCMSLSSQYSEAKQHTAKAREAAKTKGAAEVSVLLCTVTFYANIAHSLTRSP